MEFRLLGPLEAINGDAPVVLGGPKQRALLARLLLDANRTVPVDRLVDDLWGEDVPGKAVKMVQIYVSHLRKALPDAVPLTGARRDTRSRSSRIASTSSASAGSVRRLGRRSTPPTHAFLGSAAS